MTRTSYEREDKWDVPPGFELPALSGLLPAGPLATLTTDRVVHLVRDADGRDLRWGRGHRPPGP